ncbi:hypothetical protein BpHYR1_021539 [Brachionus plicatilis]|uniref:Uncharacterized protein n=1 Tax=Brachionus plicatilis TaxID=10195 RepID=A0A3M7SY60_BRAPC|nr:hypothetical protein BpHYR1_021539 [Brachionus plicatilis]
MFRLANSNLVKNPKLKQLVCLRFNTTESVKDAVQNPEAPKAPVNSDTNINQIPQQMTKLTPLYRYLVFKFSSTKYASIKDIPDELPSSQVHFAKDKGRAYMTIVGIGITVLGSFIAVLIGKRDHKRGMKHTDDIIKQHSEYSKAHQEMLKKKAENNHV